MPIESFFDAIAALLLKLFPQKRIFANFIPSEIDGTLYIGLIDIVQNKCLNRRRERALSFEVLYFLSSRDTYSYLRWAEQMLQNFERLTLLDAEGDPRMVWISGQEASRDEDNRLYRFTFDCDYTYLLRDQKVVLPDSVKVVENGDRYENPEIIYDPDQITPEEADEVMYYLGVDYKVRKEKKK